MSSAAGSSETVCYSWHSPFSLCGLRYNETAVLPGAQTVRPGVGLAAGEGLVGANDSPAVFFLLVALKGRRSIARGVSPWKRVVVDHKPRRGDSFSRESNMPQSFVSLHLHVVFSTKHRTPTITPDLQPRLYEYIGGILRGEKCSLLAAGGMPDHVHLLASLSKTVSISDALRLIKSNSSKWVHETFSKKQDFAWQTGYGAFAVSYSNLEDVKRYIANQAEHHRVRTFQEEFIALLNRHHVEFDEQFLWD